MELSTFNVRVPGFPTTDETLVYNTRTGASATLTSTELTALEALAAGAELPADLTGLSTDLLDPDVGILVSTRADEEARFRRWYDALRVDTRMLSVTVSTSFACNFACTYCCQDAHMDGQVMTADTADALARWCAERIRTTGAKRLHFNVPGGEPLLHPALVERMARAAKAAAEANGAAFTFSLITNGHFLTREIVDTLVPLGLQVVQVTLDGDEATHGLTRPTRKGKNSFRQIWENLIAVSGRVKLQLAGNYVPATLDGFPRLLDQLRAAGLGPDEIIKVVWKPALSASSTPEGGACGGSWSDAHGAERLWLLEAVRASGYSAGSVLAVGPCGIHSQNYFAVDPAGRLFECPGFVGNPEWAIGDVRSGIDAAKREPLRPAEPLEECGACAWRPSCAGACLAQRWMAAKTPGGVNCELRYFEEVAPTALRRDYLQEHPDVEIPPDVAALVARASKVSRLHLSVLR